MFNKKLCVALVAFLLLHDLVQGKKNRKTKRRKPEEEEDHTPQPSVVSYSTFGFNDVGTYEGFVPSSPDYAKFLTNPDSTRGQTSSSYPTSPESNDFGNGFPPQPYSGQSFSIGEDEPSQASLVQYPPSSAGLFNTPSFGSNGEQHRNVAAEESYGRNTDDVNAPTYGTKLNSKKEMRPFQQYNNTDFTLGSSATSNFQEIKPVYEGRPFQDTQATLEHRPSHGESDNSFYSSQSFQSSGSNDYKPISIDSQNQQKFPRVIDFTKFKQPSYPIELDTSRLPSATPIPDVYENSESSQNILSNAYSNNNKNMFSPAMKYRNNYEQNNNEDPYDNNAFKTSNVKEDSYNYNGYSSGKDNLLISNSDTDHKKKTKSKQPWISSGSNFKNWKEPTPSKGYEYSTNYSSMSFKYDADEKKMAKPLGSIIDELVPASSNLDIPNYQFPETDFSHFKKMPEYKVHDEEEFANFPSFKDTKLNDFDYNHYKNQYRTTPPTSSVWGNAFKTSEYGSSVKNHINANKYKYRDYEEIVNIPRRPNKINYEKPFESQPYEWPQYNRRPQKNKPYKDWSNEISPTRFKSEEDLLGLRTKDTSHPSYLPSFQSNNFGSDETDYKKLVEKWRQSYLKSKYKDSQRDYESYGTETKPIHVPMPKPYAIEVPHPVVIPVPQPYPVKVPIAKPIAVPVIREIKIPIEKLKPYPVYKDVPYPIEKLVPVRVEKEVPVPVVKPYPVHIPYIRPVFHHTKSRDEYDSDNREDDDYLPRQESKNKYSHYKKKIPNGSRNRPRRPSRSYHDRNRRRWPDRRHPSDRNDLPRMRPMEVRHPSPFKRRDIEATRFKEEPSFYKHL